MTKISPAYASPWFVPCLLALLLAASPGRCALSLELTWGTAATRQISFSATAGSYYILYSGAEPSAVTQPVALALGVAGPLTLLDSSPQSAARFYRVLQVTNSSPLDSDGDGIDDLFELSFPSCLNPLDPADAILDCDGDGRSNRDEFFLGTNPIVADAAPRLLINELDYDQIGTDQAEFVEILNLGTNSIHLDHYALVLVNGANSLEYSRKSLSGALAAGQYLVVGSSNITAAAGARLLYFNLTDNIIQNGAPDGVALVNVGLQRVLDSLSYEGGISAAVITGFPAPVNLVEGTALAATVQDSNALIGSLIRSPDGADSDNADNDWKFTSTPTPGSANVLTP